MELCQAAAVDRTPLHRSSFGDDRFTPRGRLDDAKARSGDHQRMIIAIVDDLMFLSRITQAAQAKGLRVEGVRTTEQLAGAARAGARLVLIDLDRPRLPIETVIATLKAESAAPQIVGFFSHVHAERAQQALAAGCTQALPRSA